ncbi:GYDIA family GHMP kinase [Flavobacterium rakeshii]|uniref:GYDIA family GHMP kinase n=1 Tax=Flavobacterium rakeshii TaxID=1038845 RepID=UPI002E7C436A|nr:GYDIA family GHMP kinase [Flavobacterium rakeshii]MEE1897781.1 GYDIA family GHMP kinase [Flavobacterium rakeshii]
MKQTFYSNGKLLITGEYTVLDGADAFALPTKYGQYLYVNEAETQLVKWTSFDADKSIWFEDTLSFSDIKAGKTESINPITQTLVKILHTANNMNPKTLSDSKGFDVTTELTFPRHWGLGTSSTLINNIAQWFAIDAFILLKNSFGGSGYDIACAQNNNPIIYNIGSQTPTVKSVNFNPEFSNNIYFVYLNQKQNSRSAIAAYNEKKNNITTTVNQINSITQKLLNTNNIERFMELLDKHTAIMSDVLETPPVKEQLFSDYTGSVKSLGAWGGDFVLAVSKNSDTASYFKQKGYPVVIQYKDMIL